MKSLPSAVFRQKSNVARAQLRLSLPIRGNRPGASVGGFQSIIRRSSIRSRPLSEGSTCALSSTGVTRFPCGRRIRRRASRRVQSMGVEAALVRGPVAQGRLALTSRRMRDASCARARAAYAVRGCAVARTDEVFLHPPSLRSRESLGDASGSIPGEYVGEKRRVRSREEVRERSWLQPSSPTRVLQDVLRPDEPGVHLDGQEARERRRGDTRRAAEADVPDRSRGQRGPREKEQYQVRRAPLP